ncbi:MAG: hypothetical protein DWQ08_01410 [Proteobacteria bacterium]|nr:MAG: hypothetical protein DWQ08_01410 [Pseudomonadota bacterium]
MDYLVDTHVHIYPFYDAGKALASSIENMAGQRGRRVARVACLTERFDCFLFDEIRSEANAPVNATFEIEPRTPSLLKLRSKASGDTIFLAAGQQVITAENIEILSLGTEKRVPEGESAVDTVRNVIEANGLPVVAWAPGKWFFKRGDVVRNLLREFSPRQLALGDTSLRPLGWLLPRIMREAAAQGFRILAGSDPLPHPAEEVRPGSYYTQIEGLSGEVEALFSEMLAMPPSRLRSRGRRSWPSTVARRIFAYKSWSKRRKTVDSPMN